MGIGFAELIILAFLMFFVIGFRGTLTLLLAIILQRRGTQRKSPPKKKD